VNGNPLKGPYPAGAQTAVLALGCYWGAERKFWQVPGVLVTAVGNAGGFSPNPSYEELLKVFFESHDPTQGLRQGNDVGSQYRSAIYWTTPDQRDAAVATRDAYQAVLTHRGLGEITTEIRPLSPHEPDGAGPLYYAEDYHQQYLHKNPHGYRCHSTTGVPFPASG
jgi:peptide-methionine (S)-S-oxide reductase